MGASTEAPARSKSGGAGPAPGAQQQAHSPPGGTKLSSRNFDWIDDAEKFGATVRGRDEGARKRRERRRPNAKRTVADIVAKPDEKAAPDAPKFSDRDLEHLHQRGYFDTLYGLVKGGKEATVYLVGRGEERLAAKVYADLESRSFRNDSAYWSGVHIADRRIAKAIRQRSRAGQAARQAIWALREYVNLWRLLEAGLPVPRPAIGPAISECAEAGSVVLMEFVGEGDAPAPRLSDVRLTDAEAADAYRQSVDILLALARLGLVHGDYSTYNLLWHAGRVVLIDVPQLLEVKSAGRQARELLERDVASLVTSFRSLGVEADPEALRREVLGALP